MNKNEFDEMERDVITVLDDVAARREELSSDGDWTTQIKNGLMECGHRYEGFSTYASSCENSDGGEWLYDVCWLKMENKHVRRVPLILESEWDMSLKGLMDDFPKLVVGRAEHRVMIFQAKNKVKMREALREFHNEIEGNPMTLMGDRYLFACWDISKKEFIYRSHVARFDQE